MASQADPSGRSLQRRMDAALLVPLCAIMVLAAIISYYLAAHFARIVHDRWLSDSVNSLAQVISSGPRGVELDLNGPARALFGWDAEDRTWFRLLSPTRGTIAGSTKVPVAGAADDAFGDTRLFDTTIDGERVRVARLDLPPAQYGEALQLLVAETVRKRARTAREIAIAVFIPQVLLSALAVFLLLRAVRRTVHPVERLAAQLNAQSHLSLDPLPLAGAPREVSPLILALNDLLARLKAAVDSQHQFLATAAHDLRTPLAAALLHLERVRAADSTSTHALATAQIALRRATRAANQVLSLARAEATPATLIAVDLCALARQIGAEFAPAALARRHSLSLEVPEAAVVALGDHDLLAAAVANLIDNAIKYTPPGSDITVAVLAGDLAGIRITDNGPGMPCGAQERAVDERFVRGEHAARDGIEGAGLGLAIAREVAARHDGALQLTDAPGGGGTMATLWVRDVRADPGIGLQVAVGAEFIEGTRGGTSRY